MTPAPIESRLTPSVITWRDLCRAWLPDLSDDECTFVLLRFTRWPIASAWVVEDQIIGALPTIRSAVSRRRRERLANDCLPAAYASSGVRE